MSFEMVDFFLICYDILEYLDSDYGYLNIKHSLALEALILI